MTTTAKQGGGERKLLQVNYETRSDTYHKKSLLVSYAICLQ